MTILRLSITSVEILLLLLLLVVVLITFAAQLPFGTQRFAAFTEANYIVTVLDPGDAPNIAKGDIIYIPEDAVSITSATDTASGLTSGSISLAISEGYFWNYS